MNNIFPLIVNSGEEFLKVQFIDANKRDKVLLVMIGSLFFAPVLFIIITIATRNETYSTYQLVRNDFHWTTSFLAFGLFAFLEAFLILDLILDGKCILESFSTLLELFHYEVLVRKNLVILNSIYAK